MTQIDEDLNQKEIRQRRDEEEKKEEKRKEKQEGRGREKQMSVCRWMAMAGWIDRCRACRCDGEKALG